jgi:hypothetical protein
MNSVNSSGKSTPIWGLLSLVLSPLGLILTVYIALGAGSGDINLGRIIPTLYLLIFFLGSGLLSGIFGIIKRESPTGLSIAGFLLNTCIISTIAFFLYSLDD